MTEPNSLLRCALGLKEDETPFPWQEDLLVRFQHGDIPETLDIPTGLGKTSVMAVWLAARVWGARLPRRLVYIVDRRAVVDQATEEAMRLRHFMDSNPDLGRRLGLCVGQPLPISTLRGRFVDNREWLDDPASPAVIVGTVDMVGSRLLFEGYGVSRKMRPYHAGLLGADSLLVLDEAHLVPPFEHLLRSIATDSTLHPLGERCRQYVPPCRVLTLSATGRTGGNGVVGLTQKDLDHPVVRCRLHAKKSLRFVALDSGTRLEEALADQAWALTAEGVSPVRVLVYANSREVARRAKEAVERRAKGDRKTGTPAVAIDTELLVGARRVFEREAAKERLSTLGFIAGSTVARSKPVFLFATSAGEVGIDLDADHMVCDLVAWERMVQRLGRVNRRGEPQDQVAEIVVLPDPEPENIWQLLTKSAGDLSPKERKTVEHFTRIRATQRALLQLPVKNGGFFDVSPGALQDLKRRATADDTLRKILEEATTPEPLRPALTRPLVDAWAMTSLEKHTGRPAIQPWLRGWIEDEPPQTTVVWRSHLPVRAGHATPRNEEVESFFEAAPVHASEILEAETSHVVRWLQLRAKCLRKEQEAGGDATRESCPAKDQVVAFALAPDGRLRKAFNLGELDRVEDGNGLAGAMLIVDARLGGLRDGLLDEKESSVPRTVDDGKVWLGEGTVGFRVRSADTSAEPVQDGNWRERFRLATEVTEDGEAVHWLVVDKWGNDAATEDDRSLMSCRQLLDDHESLAEACCRHLAQAIGLGATLGEVLALAARFHDEGKRAGRWQRAFRAPRDAVYAKTEGPIDQRLLDGYRHELGTLIRVQNDERILALAEEHRDLVLHLIAAHHGFARPVIGTRGCEDAPPSALEEEAVEIALRFARLQASWGPWGLAWLEALLRAADQQASRYNGASECPRGSE